MSELPWLASYSGETTRKLIDLERTFRKDSIVVAFEQAIDQKSFRIGSVDLLTQEERVVLAVEALEREVNNGGYDQFFLNTSEALVTEVVGSLDLIGRGDLAKLTQRAIDIAASHGGSRSDLLDAEVVEALGQCDSEYFQIAGDLAEPLFEFIKHAQERISLP
jgi:hypothetical protein